MDQAIYNLPVTTAFFRVTLGCSTKIKCEVEWRVVWPCESHQRTHQWIPPFAWKGFGSLWWVISSLFLQVVGSDSTSSVSRKVADMGQKVKQLHRCRSNAETFTMALTITRTRLFTAGTDGKVKEGGRTHGAAGQWWDFLGGKVKRRIV